METEWAEVDGSQQKRIREGVPAAYTSQPSAGAPECKSSRVLRIVKVLARMHRPSIRALGYVINRNSLAGGKGGKISRQEPNPDRALSAFLFPHNSTFFKIDPRISHVLTSPQTAVQRAGIGGLVRSPALRGARGCQLRARRIPRYGSVLPLFCLNPPRQ